MNDVIQIPAPSSSDPTSISHESVTVTASGTSVQVASNIAQSITIKALITNLGTIYVGGSSVSSANGFPLLAGDTVSLDISNTDKVWIDASISGEKINWISNA
jgi:hypothetical protein